MKLSAEYATETNIDSDGCYVIEQAFPDGDGAVVYLSRHQAEKVAAEISDLLKEFPVWGSGEAE